MIMNALFSLLSFIPAQVKTDFQTTVAGNMALGVIVNMMSEHEVNYVGACSLFALYNTATYSTSTALFSVPSYMIGVKVGKKTKEILALIKEFFENRDSSSYAIIQLKNFPAQYAHVSLNLLEEEELTSYESPDDDS